MAALARFPEYIVPSGKFNYAFDLLIVIVMLRDHVVDKRIHRVFLIGLPLIVAGQLVQDWVRQAAWRSAIARQILG